MCGLPIILQPDLFLIRVLSFVPLGFPPWQIIKENVAT